MYSDQPYGYQPYRMGNYGQQPMYQPYQTYQQTQPQQNQQQTTAQQEQFYCRPVASAEEARAVPVDFGGKPMFFTQLNAGKIYLKLFDTGSGSAIFREFRIVDHQPEAPAQGAVAFAPMSELEQLRAAVAELQNEVRAMKGGKRKAQEVIPNDE